MSSNDKRQAAMSTTRVYDKPFQESWAYPNQLKSELKAASYDIQPFPGSFKSGRSKWMAIFMNGERKVIARRIGMELVSARTGEPYNVFSREEWVDREPVPPRTILRRETASDYSLDDVLVGEPPHSACAVVGRSPTA